jgi:hypothetical protein
MPKYQVHADMIISSVFEVEAEDVEEAEDIVMEYGETEFLEASVTVDVEVWEIADESEAS